MKTSQYKKGVQQIVVRAREVNPQIGSYKHHAVSGSDHFVVQLSNGTILLPRQVANSQEVFPPHVSADWIREIAHSFEVGAGK